MPSEPRKLYDWLLRQTGEARLALDRAERLATVNRDFRTWLKEPWADDVRIAAVDGDTAVVFVSHAAAAALLRFRAPSVLAFVREHCNPLCTDLQIKVLPETYAAK